MPALQSFSLEINTYLLRQILMVYDKKEKNLILNKYWSSNILCFQDLKCHAKESKL